MRGLLTICIVISAAFGCTDQGNTNETSCEGEACYLLGCQWEISASHCDATPAGEYAAWTETSFGCDNPDHDGVTQAGHVDCETWEVCSELEGQAGCIIP